MKGRLTTCSCGAPTDRADGLCAMCATDGGLFQPPTRPAPPMPKIKPPRPDYETMLRDEFAGRALAGMLARDIPRAGFDYVAADAYRYANAMMEARNENR